MAGGDGHGFARPARYDIAAMTDPNPVRQAAPLLMIPGPVEVSPPSSPRPPARRRATRLPASSKPSAPRSDGCARSGRPTRRASRSSSPAAARSPWKWRRRTCWSLESGRWCSTPASSRNGWRRSCRRAGAAVTELAAPVGETPGADEVRDALQRGGPFKALFATHVDTSTGVRIDPEPLCRLAREAGVPGRVRRRLRHGRRALRDGSLGGGPLLHRLAKGSRPASRPGPDGGWRAGAGRPHGPQVRPPPLYLDWHSWLPVHRAYEERKPSYFATPATTLVIALEAGLGEIVATGAAARIALHARAAAALNAAWRALGLRTVPKSAEVTANTLSVLLFPEGVDASLLPKIAARGVTVAGGLHPAVRATSFRVGHMGYAVTRPDYLRRAVEAVAGALREAGAVDTAAEEAALQAIAAFGSA